MEIGQAILKRRSIRLFKPDAVPRSVIDAVLEESRWSPSGSNTQPWQVLVLGGRILDDFKRRVAEASYSQSKVLSRGNPDIPFPIWAEPYKARVKNLMSCIGNIFISKHDDKKSKPDITQLFGAPAATIIYTERSICPKAILDLGLFSQTVALSAMANGLGTCMTTYGVSRPEIIREMFKIGESTLIAICIAIGYPDTEAEINNFERSREPVSSFTHWYGFEYEQEDQEKISSIRHHL